MAWDAIDELLEKEVEQPAMDYAEARGWYQIKIMRASKRGFPDRYLARIENGKSRHILIEFKRPGKDARPQQKVRHRELREHGVEVYVIDNLTDAFRILK